MSEAYLLDDEISTDFFDDGLDNQPNLFLVPEPEPEANQEDPQKDEVTFSELNFDPLILYMRSIRRLPAYEERELIRRKDDDDEAKKKFIESNLPLVIDPAKQHRGYGVELLDLIQAGNVGVIRATEDFDVSRGKKFSTLAMKYIFQELKQAIADMGRELRVPIHVIDRRRDVARAKAKFSREDVKPTEEDLTIATGLTTVQRDYLDRKRHEVGNMLRLDTVNRQHNRKKQEEIYIGSSDPTAEAAIDRIDKEEKEQMISLALAALDNLNPREQRVLRHRFGIDGAEEKTLEELGEELGVTKERVRQIQSQGLDKLRAEISS